MFYYISISWISVTHRFISGFLLAW